MQLYYPLLKKLSTWKLLDQVGPHLRWTYQKWNLCQQGMLCFLIVLMLGSVSDIWFLSLTYSFFSIFSQSKHHMNYHSEKYLLSSWYTKRYCSNVWTQFMRCILKFYTISKTESYLFLFAHLIASMTVPKVPVLPIPALQWMTNI